MLPDLPLDPCEQTALVLDTPRFRLTATRCPEPVLAETTGERLCSWTVVAEGSRITLEPYQCTGTAPDWTFELSSPVAVRTELLRVSTLSPAKDDGRSAVFVDELPADTLRMEVPPELIRLRDQPVCNDFGWVDVLVRADIETCGVTWVVDWLGYAWATGISGCSAGMVDGVPPWELRGHPAFCPWQKDGVPQVHRHVEHVQMLRPVTARGIELRESFELDP